MVFNSVHSPTVAPAIVFKLFNSQNMLGEVANNATCDNGTETKFTPEEIFHVGGGGGVLDQWLGIGVPLRVSNPDPV